MIRPTRFASIILVVVISSDSLIASAQDVGDYRTIGSGSWSAIGIWERYDGNGFIPAATPPSSNDGVITIRNGDGVGIYSNLQIDQVVVESGGSLGISTFQMAISDGPGVDLLVHGTLYLVQGQVNGPGNVVVSASGEFFLATSGWVGSTLTIDLEEGSSTSVQGGFSIPRNDGIINNHGTATVISAGLRCGVCMPAQFNNMANGELNFDSIDTISTGWMQNTLNHGVIRKNGNGTLWINTMNFLNEPDGHFKIYDGVVRRDSPWPEQSGEFIITDSAQLINVFPLGFGGHHFRNEGVVTGQAVYFTSSDPQLLDGGGIMSSMVLYGAGGAVLGDDLIIQNSLEFSNGLLDLGDHDLVLLDSSSTAIIGGSHASHINTTGTGVVDRIVAGSSYFFPVGVDGVMSPVTLSLVNGPSETFRVRVLEGAFPAFDMLGDPSGQPLTENVVDRTWIIMEGTEGGNTVEMSLRWNPGQELVGFDHGNCMIIGIDGTIWSSTAPGPAGGNGPYTRTDPSVSSFRNFIVGDADLIGVGSPEQDHSVTMSVHPTPTNDGFRVLLPDGERIAAVHLLDAAGKRYQLPVRIRVEEPWFDVSSFPPGLYIVDVLDTRGHHRRSKLVVKR